MAELKLKPIGDLVLREYLLENDTWLPSQVISRDGSRALPERNLLFELLAGALHDLDNPTEKYRKRAMRWLLSSNYKAAFTCSQVCDYLGLSHQSLKTKVKAGLKLLRSRRDSAIRHHVTDEIPFYAPEIASRIVQHVTLQQLQLFTSEVEACQERLKPCNSSPAPASSVPNSLKSLGTCILLATSPKTSEMPCGNGSGESAKESPS